MSAMNYGKDSRSGIEVINGYVEGNHRPIITSDNFFGRLLNNLPRTDYLGLALIAAIKE
ncbi:MAG: hypothetical protein WBZ36_19450 [Candidatus Nitrosopolaris sp.]